MECIFFYVAIKDISFISKLGISIIAEVGGWGEGRGLVGVEGELCGFHESKH